MRRNAAGTMPALTGRATGRGEPPDDPRRQRGQPKTGTGTGHTQPGRGRHAEPTKPAARGTQRADGDPRAGPPDERHGATAGARQGDRARRPRARGRSSNAAPRGNGSTARQAARHAHGSTGEEGNAAPLRNSTLHGTGRQGEKKKKIPRRLARDLRHRRPLRKRAYASDFATRSRDGRSPAARAASSAMAKADLNRISGSAEHSGKLAVAGATVSRREDATQNLSAAI